MPIVFVHGVANRKDASDNLPGWVELEAYLRRYITPVISDHKDVQVVEAYWGDLGASFAWNGCSRPRSLLLSQGSGEEESTAERASALACGSPSLKMMLAEPVRKTEGRLVAAGPTLGSSPVSGIFRFKDLNRSELSDVLAAEISYSDGSEEEVAFMRIIVDEIANDSGTTEALANCESSEEEVGRLECLIQEQMYRCLGRESDLAAQGAGFRNSLANFRDRLNELAAKVNGTPGFLASRLAVEARRPLNDLATLFLGDVFGYLDNCAQFNDFADKKQRDRSIPHRILITMQEAKANASDEPLIVLSHSMGGQIVYDLVTHYLANSEEFRNLRIDYWCATASQVGLFAELNLFRQKRDDYGVMAEDPARRKLPLPDLKHLGGWWNVWDYNDILSYTCREIFDKVDDTSFSSGMSVVSAHGGYLKRPSFFREFERRLRKAKTTNWGRS